MEECELVAREFSLRFVVLDPTCPYGGWEQVFLLYNNLTEDLGQEAKKPILNSPFAIVHLQQLDVSHHGSN